MGQIIQLSLSTFGKKKSLLSIAFYTHLSFTYPPLSAGVKRVQVCMQVLEYEREKEHGIVISSCVLHSDVVMEPYNNT